MSGRHLVLVRTAWGLALLSAPRLLARVAGHGASSTATEDFARLLGGRHLVQAAATARHPTFPVLLTGAAADALHATTGVALGVLAARWRRAVLLDAAVAAAFATGGVAAARRARRGRVVRR